MLDLELTRSAGHRGRGKITGMVFAELQEKKCCDLRWGRGMCCTRPFSHCLRE